MWGVEIFTKEYLQCSIGLAKSIPKQFDLLVLYMKLSNSFSLSVAGMYPRGLKQCSCAFHQVRVFILGNLNWDMLKPPEKVVQQFDCLNLHQIINLPTKYNPKSCDNATLIDVVFTNAPLMSLSGVFCNDLSDHCFIACVRKQNSVKQPVVITT